MYIVVRVICFVFFNDKSGKSRISLILPEHCEASMMRSSQQRPMWSPLFGSQGNELCLTSPSLVVSSPDATVWHIVLAETLVLVACAGFVQTSVGTTVKQKVQEETTRSIDNRTMQYSMYSLVWHLVIYLLISFVWFSLYVYRVFLSYSIPCHPCDARYQSLWSQTQIGTCTILCQSIQSASQAGRQSVCRSVFLCLFGCLYDILTADSTMLSGVQYIVISCDLFSW